MTSILDAIKLPPPKIVESKAPMSPKKCFVPCNNIILLHTRPLRDNEKRTLRVNFPVVMEFDNDIHAHKTIVNLAPPTAGSTYPPWDILIIPIYTQEGL